MDTTQSLQRSRRDLQPPAPQADVPAGFDPLRAPPGFVHEIGGFHVHHELDVVAMRVSNEHINSIGIAHGGFLATLADTAFGVLVKRQCGLVTSPATVSLTVDYIGPARAGDWLEAHVEVHKVGRRLTNASCMLRVGQRLIARASGVFIMP